MKSSMLVAVLFGMMVASTQAAPTLIPDLAQGRATVEKACVTCHTIDGNSVAPIYPILAGQHVEYLQKQLRDFKTGARLNDVMQPWAMQLSDQDIVNVSAYYASQPLKQRTAGDQALANTGAKIYQGGILDKHLPACAACHGPSGDGMASQYPRLGSQHVTYTEAQLQAFKKGTRKNSPVDMMNAIAAQLTDEDIKALSEYISGLR